MPLPYPFPPNEKPTLWQVLMVVGPEWFQGVQDHVHDGDETLNGHNTKIDPSGHIAWGDNGHLTVTEDTNSLGAGFGHEVTHEHIGGGANQVARWTSDQLKAKAGQLFMGARGLLEALADDVATLVDVEFKDQDGTAPVRGVMDVLKLNSATLPGGASAIDTLCKANLPKMVAKIRVEESGGVWTYSIRSGSYNFAAVRMVTVNSLGTDVRMIEIDADTHFGATAAIANVGFYRTATDEDFSKMFLAKVDLDAYTSPTVARIVIMDGTSPFDLNAAAPAGYRFDVDVVLF